MAPKLSVVPTAVERDVVVLLSLTVSVPALRTSGPVNVLAAEKVSSPAPVLVRVWPAPPSPMAPRVRVVPVAGLRVALSESVVAPKVTAAVPEETLSPVARASVWAPRARVPSVWVTPAPAVARLERRVASPLTTVL